MEEFIKNWQTLIGGALGPFLLGLGFWIKEIIKTKKERKEFLRRIEISITRSLDDTNKTRQKLQHFVSKLKNLITGIKTITNNRHFSLETTNYPTIRSIYTNLLK